MYNTISKSKKGIILAGLILLLTSFQLLAVSYNCSFDSNDLEFTVNDSGYDVVRLNDLPFTDEVGAPQLVVKYVKLIIPAGQEVSNITINKTTEGIEGTYLITPAQKYHHPEDTTWTFTEPDADIYDSNELYPAEVLEVVNYGYFDGANHIVTIAVYPIQYIPSDSVLIFNNYVDFSLDFTTSFGPTHVPQYRLRKDVNVYKRVLRAIVDNPGDIPMYGYTPTKLDNAEDYYDYVIVGPENLLPYFDEFQEWKEKKGNIVKRKSIEWITQHFSSYHGITDSAAAVKAYLASAYEDSGLVYALLVGDEDVCPIRIGYGKDNPIDPEDEDILADLYFAEFDGDWNVDGDTLYGEPTHDAPEYEQEIFIGRLIIPSDNAEQEIANWTEKLIVYENYPGYGNFEYLNNAYINAMDHPGLTNPTQWNNYLEDYIYSLRDSFYVHGFDNVHIDDGYNSLHPTGEEVINEINEGYGIISTNGHGGPTQIHVSSHIDSLWNCTNHYVHTLDDYDLGGNSEETGNGLDCLAENNKYSIFYSINCRTAAFDLVDPDLVCFARGFTSYLANKGGPAYLGNTRNGFYDHSGDLQKHFFTGLLNDKEYVVEEDTFYCNHVGVAEAYSKAKVGDTEYGDKHWVKYCHNLIGEPEMSVWTAVPSYIQVTHNYVENSITVTTNGNPVSNALVFFERPDDNLDEIVYTNDNGIAQCFFEYTDVSVTKHNYIPYLAHIVPTEGENWTGETDVRWLTIVPENRTLNIADTVNLVDYAGRNAKIVVEQGGTLILADDSKIIGNAKTIEFPGNIVEVYGDIVIGANVEFIAGEEEGKTWDGLYVYNNEIELGMNNVTFENCELYSESDGLTIYGDNSSFTNSHIYQSNGSVDISNTDFYNTAILCERGEGRTAQISECSFDNCGTNGEYAINISGYTCYRLNNNEVHNSEGGFKIDYSGSPRNCDIAYNIIENCNLYGIRNYQSHADIRGANLLPNLISGNSIGIYSLNRCSISLFGDELFGFSTIIDNDNEEIVFDESCFPAKIRYNEIIDDDYNLEEPDQYLFRCLEYTGGSRELCVEYNYWGDGSEFWEEWDGDHRFDPSEAFDYIPTWIAEGGESDSTTLAEELYASADSLIENEEYESAKQTYKDIIELYPESKYAVFSMRNLLPLETVSGQDFISLQQYYQTNPNCHYNDDMSKLSDKLIEGSYEGVKKAVKPMFDFLFNGYVDMRSRTWYSSVVSADTSLPYNYTKGGRATNTVIRFNGLNGSIDPVTDVKFIASLYSLRHSAGTTLVAKTGDMLLASKLLGHSNLATTQRYVKMADDRLKDGVNLL